MHKKKSFYTFNCKTILVDIEYLCFEKMYNLKNVIYNRPFRISFVVILLNIFLKNSFAT